MENEKIIQKINSFESWFYQFDLKGNLTPTSNKRRKIRNLKQKKYFFEPLVELLGGSLAGKRVLDLGCNAGFWSLAAIESGCEFVLGIDGRKMHIDQANFVFEVKEIEKHRYEFIAGNVFEFDFQKYGNFDIVLCLGLIYHVSKPMLLMEQISKVNTDILVIDTDLLRAPGSYLEFYYDNIEDPVAAVDYQLVIHPTKQAVFKMAKQFNYSVVMLKPRLQDYKGVRDYKYGLRRAFLCAKKTSLSNLNAKTERITLGTYCMDIPIWLAMLLARRLPLKWRIPLGKILR